MLARRRACSTLRAPSISLWKLGTSARSSLCLCAAALRQGHRAPAHSAAHGGDHKPCTCAGAAQSMFSSASSFNQPVEAWDVGRVISMNVRRRPASYGHQAPAHTQLLRGVAATSRECVCWRGAGDVQWRELLQPACGCMGRRPGHRHAGAPPPCVNVAGFSHIAVLGGAATYCVRVLARHSICSETQALSTSVWLHGTLVGSPTWLCAAPLCVGLVRT